MNNRINRKLVMDAFLMGTWRRRPAPDLIFYLALAQYVMRNAFADLPVGRQGRESLT